MDRGSIPRRSTSTSSVNPYPFPATEAQHLPPGQHSRDALRHAPGRGNSDSCLLPGNFQTLRTPTSEYTGGIANESWSEFLNNTAADSFASGAARTPQGRRGTDRNELLQSPRAQTFPAPSYHTVANAVAASRKRFASGPDASDSGEHKRSYPGMRPSSPPARVDRAGTTRIFPIDLTGSSPVRTSSFNTQQSNPARLQRASSSQSIQLPPWQPDSDVVECPVCKTVFGFWNRKHHCRKCGKVVCDGCSRHRITIPRQHIVQPPPGTANSPFSSTFSALGVAPPSRYFDMHSGLSRGLPSGDGLNSSFYGSSASVAGGAEVVRVCNPCVPDPNLSPPPQTPASGQTGAPPHYNYFEISPQSFAGQAGPVGARPPPIPERRGSGLHGFGNSSANPSLQRGYGGRWGDAPSAVTPNSQARLGVDSAYQRQIARRATLSSATARGNLPQPSNYPYRPTAPYQIAHPSSHRYSHSTASLPAQHPAQTSTPISPPQFAPLRPPRREIPEEDECPVCGHELPPKGANGDTKAREKHVEDCITLHSFSASTVSAPTSGGESHRLQPSSLRPGVPTPNPARSGISDTLSGSQAVEVRSRAPDPPRPALGASASSAPSAAASGSASQPPLPQRVNRMIVYKASEKDCLGEDGEAQECVICFEEFEPGEEMGRLECLCKFHRACIRRWWETKGPGSCPTHQLHS